MDGVDPVVLTDSPAADSRRRREPRIRLVAPMPRTPPRSPPRWWAGSAGVFAGDLTPTMTNADGAVSGSPPADGGVAEARGSSAATAAGRAVARQADVGVPIVRSGAWRRFSADSAKHVPNPPGPRQTAPAPPAGSEASAAEHRITAPMRAGAMHSDASPGAGGSAESSGDGLMCSRSAWPARSFHAGELAGPTEDVAGGSPPAVGGEPLAARQGSDRPSYMPSAPATRRLSRGPVLLHPMPTRRSSGRPRPPLRPTGRDVTAARIEVAGAPTAVPEASPDEQASAAGTAHATGEPAHPGAATIEPSRAMSSGGPAQAHAEAAPPGVRAAATRPGGDPADAGPGGQRTLPRFGGRQRRPSPRRRLRATGRRPPALIRHAPPGRVRRPGQRR